MRESGGGACDGPSMTRGFEALRRGTIEMIVSSSSRDHPCFGSEASRGGGGGGVGRAGAHSGGVTGADGGPCGRVERRAHGGGIDRLGTGGPDRSRRERGTRSSSGAAAAAVAEAAALSDHAVRASPPWPALAAAGVGSPPSESAPERRPRRRRPKSRGTREAPAFDADGRRTLGGGGTGRAAGLSGEPPAAADAAPRYTAAASGARTA